MKIALPVDRKIHHEEVNGGKTGYPRTRKCVDHHGCAETNLLDANHTKTHFTVRPEQIEE